MLGMLAISLAGHDKNKIYIIIEDDDEYVYLSDGILRTGKNLKKKKKKHIQLIKKDIDSSLQRKLRNKEFCSDEEIKRAIKLFKAETMQEENICQNPT